MKLTLDNSFIAQNVYFQKYKSFIVPALLILISVLMIGAIIVPTVYSYFKNRADLQKVKNEKAFYEKKLSELKSLDTENYQENLNLVLQALPENQDIPESLTYLLNSISGNRLRIDNVFVSSNEKTSGDDHFTLKVDVTGGITQVKDLINDIRNQPRLMQITGLNFSATETGSFTTSLTIDVYYKELPKTIPNSLAPLPTISATDEKLIEEIKSSFQGSLVQNASSSSPLGKSNPFEE